MNRTKKLKKQKQKAKNSEDICILEKRGRKQRKRSVGAKINFFRLRSSAAPSTRRPRKRPAARKEDETGASQTGCLAAKLAAKGRE